MKGKGFATVVLVATLCSLICACLTMCCFMSILVVGDEGAREKSVWGESQALKTQVLEPTPTSTLIPLPPSELVPTAEQEMPDIPIGTSADEVLRLLGRPLQVRNLGIDEDPRGTMAGVQGYIVEWKYPWGYLVFMRREVGGVTCYRVVEKRGNGG